MKGPSGVPETYKTPDGVLVPPELADTVMRALVERTAKRGATPQVVALMQACADAANGRLPLKEVPDTVALVFEMVASVDQAAEKLRISGRAVRDRINAGKLPAFRMGREWLIPREALT